MTPRAPTRDATPVANRLLVLQLVRTLGAFAVLAITAIVGDLDAALAAGVFVYGVLVAASEVYRRRFPAHIGGFVSSAVLLDGAALAAVVSVTGGYRSPLLFLVFLDVLAVTLLVSYRAGLKLATWCALLLLLAHAAADAGIIGLQTLVSDRVAVISAATFLLFACCAAMFSSVNERSLRHSRGQLALLVQLGAELERARHAEDVMGVLVRHTCSRLGFVRVGVLVRRDGSWYGIVDDGRVEALVTLPDRPAPVMWDCWSSSTPVLLRTLDDPLLAAVLPDATNVLVAPIAADDEPIGVVVAEWGGDESARIPTLTVQGLAQAAMHTALALRNAELLIEVERLATRDSLTGIANRRLFDESLSRETARSQRLGEPLSLIVFDVDHFKQINDTFGHPTGDAVLRHVAEALVATTKGFDVAARFGGDEFVLLLPGCSRTDAIGVADRVRAEIVRRATTAAVTISAGVATLPDNAADGERLVSAADAALYEAKRQGRDRAYASARAAESAAPGTVRWGGAPLARGA
ncbi:MAG: GGDEF domain-containing protein [Acidimicrobiia bacterium]